MVDKAPDAFRNISEVSAHLNVPAHVLRFWETRFTQIKPVKRSGGRRYYRPDDIQLLTRIRDLLYSEGYTIKGAQQVLKTGNAEPNTAAPSHEAQTVASPSAANAPANASPDASISKVMAMLTEARTRLDQLAV